MSEVWVQTSTKSAAELVLESNLPLIGESVFFKGFKISDNRVSVFPIDTRSYQHPHLAGGWCEMEEHFPTGLTDNAPSSLGCPLLPRWVVVSFPRLFHPLPCVSANPFCFPPRPLDSLILLHLPCPLHPIPPPPPLSLLLQLIEG